VNREKENRFVAPVLLSVLIVGAFLLRVVGQWDRVFVGGNVWFRGVDPWYHMRLVDNMVVNFPVPMTWDMYAAYPSGNAVGFYPLLAWIVCGISKLGFNYEVVGAIIPPILGALVLIPVYFIGKELFNKWVGLLAALLVAILPGELFHRSLLGFTDHHVLETLLMFTTILFLILAHKYNKLGYVVAAGISLGLYMLNWHGAAFFLLILGIWYAVEFTILRNRELSKIVCITALTASAVSMPYLIGAFDAWKNIVGLCLLIIMPVLFEIVAIFLKGKTFTYLVASVAATIVVLLCLPFYGEPFWGFYVLDIRAAFWGFGTHISEAEPLSLSVAFSNYGIAIFLFIGGLYYLIRRRISILFIVVAAVLLLATIGQRRWGYYFTVPVALLASYFTFLVGDWVTKNVRVAVIAIICIFMIASVILGTIGMMNLPNNMNRDWYVACTWLEKNTPDSFVNADAYYKSGHVPTINLSHLSTYYDVIMSNEAETYSHGQDVLIDGEYIYYCGHNIIKKSYIETQDWKNPLAKNLHAMTDGTDVDQINGLTVKDNYIYASAPKFNEKPYRFFVKWYDKDTLEFVGEQELFWPSEGSTQEGIAWSDNSWWVGYFDVPFVTQYDEHWNWIRDYGIKDPYTQGLFWNGDELWISRTGGDYSFGIYKLQGGDLKLLATINKPRSIKNPQGFFITGDVLWLAYYTKGEHNNLDTLKITRTESVEEPLYGVLSWWDYGHWIIRIGHRVPLASPAHQGEPWHSQFLAAQTEEAANSMLESLNIRYVMLDRAETTSKFYAIVRKAELSESITEQLRPNSMAVRLWNEQTITWKKIYGSGDVKIFERR